jgi:hypothetical protein
MGAERRRALPYQLATAGLVAATGVLLTGRIDLDPPRLEVEPAELPARAGPGLAVHVTVEDGRPGLDRLEAQVDDGPWTVLSPGEDGRFAWEPALEHGSHCLSLRAVDASWLSNTSTWTGAVEVDAEGPTAAVHFPEDGLTAGAAGWLRIEADEPLAGARLELGGRSWPLLADESGQWQALLALAVDADGGPLPWTLHLEDELGNHRSQQGTVQSRARSWSRGGTIALTAAQQAARDDTAALQAMRAARAEATGRTRAAPVLTEVQRPSAGWVSSPFGRYRSYSDGARQHHLGIDIANVLGAPVGAMAPGEVSLAADQPIHGLTVIVDHGWGVSSSYSHLSAIEVEVGAQLAAGQQLGRVGSTGQSTGPHLHWEISVGGVAVDPAAWLEALPERP